MAELRELQAFLDAGSVDAEVFALRNAAADELIAHLTEPGPEVKVARRLLASQRERGT